VRYSRLSWRATSQTTLSIAYQICIFFKVIWRSSH